MLSAESEPGSVIAGFARAREALLAALDVQRAVAAGSWPEGIDAQVRIGLQNGQIPGRVAPR